MSEVLSPRVPCRFCLNARCCSDLSDDNDGSYLPLCRAKSGFYFYIGAGGGRPVQIAVDGYDRSSQCDELIAYYFPKFCPECGRSLTQDYPEHRSVYGSEEI